MDESLAELAVRIRRKESRTGELTKDLADGPPEQVLGTPRHERTRQFLRRVL